VLYQVGELAFAYRHLHRHHWRYDQPFLLTDVYIDERLRDRMTQEDIETKTV
jgi:GntR family transcriptional regulator